MTQNNTLPYPVIFDAFDTPIRLNGRVAYPVRRGSSMWMNAITVTKIEEDKVYGYDGTGRMKVITNLKNLVVLGGASK